MTFNKESTKTIKGIAILLMFAHHIFNENPNISYLDVTVHLGNYLTTIEYLIGHFGKLCVSILTFVSGYGMYCKTKKLSIDKVQDISIKRIIAFYKIFWKYALLIILIKCILNKVSIEVFLINALGIDSTWFGSWWYVSPYLMIIFFYPLFHYWIERRRSNLCSDFICTFLLWTFVVYVYPRLMNTDIMCAFSCNNRFWWIFYQMLQLAPSFMIGMITSKYDVYSKLVNLIKNKYIRIVFSFVTIISVFVFRNSYGNVDERMLPEFVYSFFFILASESILVETKYVRALLIKLGEKSTGLWFVHGVVVINSRYNKFYLNTIGKLTTNAILYYFLTLFICYVIVISIDYVYHKFHKIGQLIKIQYEK